MNEIESSQITSLDVIENYLGSTPAPGDVAKLDDAEFVELTDLILVSAAGSALDPVPDDTIYMGGWLGGNWQNQMARDEINVALLYHQRVLLHDPIADFCSDSRGLLPELRSLRAKRGGMTITPTLQGWADSQSMGFDDTGFENAKTRVDSYAADLVGLRPLLTEGVVQLRSQWAVLPKEMSRISTSMRHDTSDPEMQASAATDPAGKSALPKWDHIRGFAVAPGGGVVTKDLPYIHQSEFFYLAKTLAITSAFGATYSPTTDLEWHLLRTKARQVQETASQRFGRTELLQEVNRQLVPSGTIDVETAIKIRENEEAFDSWRRTIRNLERDSAGDSPDELRSRVEDALAAEIPKIDLASNRIGRANRGFQEAKSDVVINAALAAAAATVAGAPLVLSSAAPAVHGVVKWLWDALRPPKLEGEQGIILSLRKSK